MLIFTNDDYRRIQAWLKKNAIKDSDFAISQETVPEEDILVITLNMATVPTNYKIKIKDLLNSSLGKIVINSITANSVKVNNVLTVDAANVKLDNEKGTTLLDVLDYFEENKLNRHIDDTFDGNLEIKKNLKVDSRLEVEGNAIVNGDTTIRSGNLTLGGASIVSTDGVVGVSGNFVAGGEISDGDNNILSDVNAASKGWILEYQDPTESEPTVREKFVLKNYKGEQKGNTIKIYKDSAITNVYLGTTEDTCNPDTGVPTKYPIHDNNEALCVVYHLENGKYNLVPIPLGAFVREAEFDKYRGLGVTPNGQVFVKLADDEDTTNYLGFNDDGEITAAGLEERILRELGSLSKSVAGDGTMWGTYKQHEGTQATSTPNDGSRWGEFKKAESIRDKQVSDEIAKIQSKVEEVNLDTIKQAQDNAVQAIADREAEILAKSDASEVSFDNTGTSLNRTNVQDALKETDGKVTELEEEAYNLSVYSGGVSGNAHYHNGVMQTDGKCGDIDSAKHVLIKVKEGDTIVVQGKNSADVSHFAMLTNYFVPQKNGDTFPLVSGESRQVVGAVEKTYTIKPSCKYIYITTFNNNVDVTPITMSVNGVDMVRSIREALKDSIASLNEEIQQEKDIRISQNTQLTELISKEKKTIEDNEVYGNVSFNVFRGKNCIATFNGVITDNGTIVDYNAAKHSVITCAEGTLLYIKSDSSSTERCMFAFLSSYERVTNNGQKLSIIGSRQTASINGTTVTAPEGSKYLLFFAYNNGQNCLPVELTIDKYDVLKGVTESISDINNALSDGSLEGKSAYEIAKEHGFVGTEQEWLESLQGKDGENGKDGPQGVKGEQGLQGNSGYSGAAGELEVVNNITSGGATSALSAEMGKQIGNFIDYNNVPLQPQTKNPAELSSCEINPSKWVVTSSAEGTTTSTLVDVYDEVYQDAKHCVELNSTRNARFVSRLGTPVSMAFNVIRCSLCIMKDVDVSKIQTLIFEVYSDGYTDSSHRAEFPVQYANPSEDSGNYNAQYVRGGWFHFCVNPNSRINSRGSSFNINNVTHVGLHLQHENGYTLKVYVAHLSVVKGLKKPGIIHIIDNFDSDVPAMADYAYSKGIKLNLSIIPNWIGGESSASLAEINRIKKQGHLIFDHTFNHIADTSGTTEEEIVDEIINGINWMERNGFARGAKIISNPSARFPFDKYKAYMESPAQMIFHHWTTMPGSPSSNGNVLLYYPFYPMTRLLNISALAGNEPTQKTSYLNNMKASIDAAATFGGIAVLGSHGTFWAMDNGASWKEVIDYAVSKGLYSYGIDEIIEGCFL